MFGATVLGFALNILSSYRVALYRHLQTLSPRF
jgi:hypothetical protein